MTTKGSKASGTGRVLEQTIVAVLKQKGFELVSHRLWSRHPEQYGKELLLTNAPFRTIYEHSGKTEFLMKSERYNLETRIECKWQQASGSVDEKLPYVYLNAIERMPEKHIMVVIDGHGWKSGAIEWLKDAVAKRKYANEASQQKKIEVMNMTEFVTWANTFFSK